MKVARGILTLLLSLNAAAACAQGLAEPGQREGAQTDGQIYGWRLMTHEERDAYLARLRAAPDATARERLRAQHHAAMQARARERGVSLPPPPGRSGSRGALRGVDSGQDASTVR